MMSARRLRLVTLSIGLTWLVASAVAAATEPATDAVDWQLLEARGAAERGEPRIAESHYRAAAREAWTLLGRIAIAEGDLAAAHAALTAARNGAAVGVESAREQLALVALHRAGVEGAVEAPLRELRFGVHERPDDVAPLVRFVQALRATGRDEEFRAELATLRELEPAVAAELDRAEPALPALDPGSVGELAAEERAALADTLRSTLAAIDEALAELPREPAVEVAPFALDPSRRLASTPRSLRDVLGLLDAGDQRAALVALKHALDGPDGPAARALLGRVLAEKGDVEAAEDHLVHAIRTDPSPGDAQLALARLCWLEGREVEAITVLRQAANAGVPIERDLAWVLVDAEIAQERWSYAREQLESLHKRFDSVSALLRLVEVARREGDPKRAFDAAERAVRLAPNAEDVLRVHARLALAVDVATRAAFSVEALARMRPEVAEYQVLLGEVWRQRRQMGEASEAYLRAIALDPERVDARKPLGLALNHESRFAEGREQLSRYLEAHPHDLDALAGLAEAEERLGETEAAEERARRVLALEPDHPRAQLVLGMVAMEQGRLDRARRSLEGAVRADPWLAKAHYQLSFACTRLGDRECSKRHLELYERALAGPESTFVQLEAAPKTETQMMSLEEPTREGGS